MDTEQIKRLAEFDTPTVANGLAMLGMRDPSAGYSGPDIRALMPDFGVRVGIAVTARLDTTSPGTDLPPSLFKEWVRSMHDAAQRGLPIFAALESVGPRPRHTVTIGDGMATIMKLAGAVAFITNGSIRDLEGVREVGLACWAAGLSPMHGQLRWLDLNSPIVIDGMTVRPGDIIHADVNGALLIPADVADQVYDQARRVRQHEQALFERWRAPQYTLADYLADP
ncbi:MAG: RraA family protein [Chloroflexi bacterium]|nr:MAG: RraA family protein [Chloroflexota bacterium]